MSVCMLLNKLPMLLAEHSNERVKAGNSIALLIDLKPWKTCEL